MRSWFSCDGTLFLPPLRPATLCIRSLKLLVSPSFYLKLCMLRCHGIHFAGFDDYICGWLTTYISSTSAVILQLCLEVFRFHLFKLSFLAVATFHFDLSNGALIIMPLCWNTRVGTVLQCITKTRRYMEIRTEKPRAYAAHTSKTSAT